VESGTERGGGMDGGSRWLRRLLRSLSIVAVLIGAAGVMGGASCSVNCDDDCWDDDDDGWFSALQPGSGREPAAPAAGLEDAEMREMRRDLAREWVVGWKTRKALYEQYGGAVVWEQFDPLEPIGAFNALLEEQHERGAYVIHDPEAARVFWQFVERVPDRFVVPPERVDFSHP